jgi:nucleoside-diphosphate-sugar epimerase
MPQTIFLTGASGSMGSVTLDELLKDGENHVVTLVRPSSHNRQWFSQYQGNPQVTVRWGDLTCYEDVLACVKGSDIVLHVGALVSPAADYHPKEAMKVNFGSTVNIIRAIKEQSNCDQIKLVYVGTIAETGDRLPPIHWGRVGDPIKPSVHDYYAVSKVAAERAVIESGLKYWVSLRQTGILSRKMAEIEDSIMFHNCLDNVLEYVTDRDSGVLMRHVCGKLPEEFWGHIYNIGGGVSCRISCYEMLREMFGRLNITSLDDVFEGNWFATRNFHGQYYLDGDKLDQYLHFRNDDLEYFYHVYMQVLGAQAFIVKCITHLPGGKKLIASLMKKRFLTLARTERGTMNFIEHHRTDFIIPFFISEQAWSAIPKFSAIHHFVDWNKVIPIDHGYDENKPESELSLKDVQGAAEFRGGKCLSNRMQIGDWTTKMRFRCAFHHEFDASPRLILEGGHWCDQCERESWNYHEIAKVSPFFAQVWYPLHDRNEPSRVYKKVISELDIEPA